MAVPPGETGLAAPLQVPLFRRLWLGNMVSNFGWLIQSVGAAWLMTELVGTADWVGLVQTALLLPILIFALPAGVLADVGDRRRVCMLGQSLMLLAALSLAIVTFLGLTTPVGLLLFTFALGTGSALANAPFQTLVRESVPPAAMGAAVTLNAISFNLARSVGPAIGGVLVAAIGAQAAFLTNALCYLPLLLVLFAWRRPTVPMNVRGRMRRALGDGIRFANQSVPIRAVLAYTLLFGFCASCLQALLPLIARDRLDGDAITYGLLLGAFGLGAMGGAFLIHPIRYRFGSGLVITWLGAQFGLASLAVAYAGSIWLMAPMLALTGAAWLGQFSSFNIAVQRASAVGIEARQLAIYQTAVFGSMAAGAWVWGELAHAIGLEGAVALSGLLLLAGSWLAWRLIAILDRPPASAWQA